MEKNSEIYVADHGGMVGSAIIRNLEDRGYTYKVELKSGIERVYEWYLESKK